MFIACEGYKRSDNYRDFKVPIFDTNDCTVEYCDIRDVRKTIGVVENALIRQNGVTIEFSDIRRHLIHCDSGYVRMGIDTDVVYIGNKEVQICSLFGRLIVNHVNVLLNCDQYSLAYIFKFRDYLILRFYRMGKKWFSCAVNDGVVEYWMEDLSICTNRALSMQIDMSSEV